MWYCTECGSPTVEGNAVDGVFTSIDTRTRYNLGTCTCTPLRNVAVVRDPALAADIACGLGVFQATPPEQTTWLD